MRYGLQFRDVFAAWESLLEGVYITLLLSAFAMLGGLTIGIICAAARVYGPRWLKGIAAGYVEIIRNTPLLVQLFLIFFGFGLFFRRPMVSFSPEVSSSSSSSSPR